MNYSEIKNWLESHAHRYFEPKHEEFKVMLQILQKHHNYKNWKFQDVLAFKITRSPKKKAIQVLVNFAQNSDDGSKRKGKGKEKWRNVSWKACCDDIKAKKITRHAKINQAMRFSIKPQIKQFRTQNPNEICDICRTTQHIEVDHYMQLFSDIRDNFLKLENNDIVRISVLDSGKGTQVPIISSDTPNSFRLLKYKSRALSYSPLKNFF